MKSKRFNKIAIISLLLVLVIALSWFLNQLGLPLKTYADAKNEAVSNGYFADMRKELKVELSEKEEALPKNKKEAIISEKKKEKKDDFETLEFQRKDENFDIIYADEIAKIKDERYGVTLGEEAEKITLKSREYKNEDGKTVKEVIGPKITEEPTLTVFTYGQGSTLHHWSNAGELKDKDTQDERDEGFNMFAYQRDSIIEILRRKADADVYIVKTMAFNLDEEKGTTCEFDVSLNRHAKLLLYKLEPTVESYNVVNSEFNSNTPNRVTRIEDMTKHNIILFDANSASTYHDYVYNELNVVLTQLSYDYLLTIGQVPKISMISHSTGGVWNMMWANRHPLNVDKLLAIAAPFSGSTTGYLLHRDWGKISYTIAGNKLENMHSMVTNPSGLNNIDAARYTKLCADWNEAVKVNEKLQCYAFTGLMSADLVEDMGFPGISESIVGRSYLIQLLIASFIADVAILVAELITIGAISLGAQFLGTGAILLTVALAGVAVNLLSKIVQLVDSFGEIGKYVIKSLTIDKNGELCLMDDGLVDYNSALGYVPILHYNKDIDVFEGEDINEKDFPAIDFDEDRKQEWYSNFVRFEKTFRPDNTDLNKKTTAYLAAPHNMETMDSDIISHVAENTIMGKPETRYEFAELQDDTFCIAKIKEGFYNEHIVIPDTKDGKKISYIGDNAAQGVTDISCVEIGKNIEYIGECAFDASSLTKINLNNGLRYIGYGAFKDTLIENICLPATIQEIGVKAFANSNLNIVRVLSEKCECVKKYNELVRDYNEAIEKYNIDKENKKDNKNELSCDCAFLALSNKNYFIVEPKLEDYIDNDIINNDNDSETAQRLNEIENGLYNEAVNIYNEHKDKNCNCSNQYNKLNDLYFVGEDAFADTSFLKDAVNNIVFGKVLIKYNSNETEYTLTKVDDIKYFAAKCFKGSAIKNLDVATFEFKENTIPDNFLFGAENLETVTLPNNIVIIGTGAFAYTSSLKEINIPITVELIGIEAFAYSGVEKIILDSGYPPIISVSDTFKGHSENLLIYVKGFAKDNFKNLWCKSDASNIIPVLNEESIISSKKALFYYESLDSEKSLKEEDVEYFGYLGDYKYSKEGYEFKCWQDENGNEYYNGMILHFGKNKDWKLYAVMSELKYNIYFEVYGGQNPNDIEFITLNGIQQLEKAQKVGYNFVGWFDNANFIGEGIDVLSNITHDTKLYAKFEPIEGVITYYSEDLTIDSTTQDFVYGQRFDSPIPKKSGYEFGGWYTKEGERITSIYGASLKKCFFTENITLYAHWTAKSFVIEYNDGTDSYVLGDSGLTPNASSVMVGEKIDVNSKALASLFKREGYIFDRFEDVNGKEVDFSKGVPDLGKNFSTFTICPVLKPEQYTFILYDGFGGYYGTFDVEFDANYAFEIDEKKGYIFKGWADQHGIIFENKEGVITRDFTPGVERNCSVELKAVWEPLKGNIRFESNGGTKVIVSSDYTVMYDRVLPSIDVPKRLGYTFLGFYDSNGDKYIENDGTGCKVWKKTDSFVTLYAHWKLNTYNLHYNFNNSQKNDIQPFDAEHIITFPVDVIKVGYTFMGWYSSEDYQIRVYDTSNVFKEYNVYAKWIENTYTIANNTEIIIEQDNCSIRLDKISTAVSYRVITLTDKVNSILLSYSTSVKIVIISKAIKLDLHLNNAKFAGLIRYDSDNKCMRGEAIIGNSINIFAVGCCEITGADGTDGVKGTNGNSSYDHGVPSNSSPKAGRGDDGGKGGNGGDGFVAIYAKYNLTITGLDNADLTINGGNGGKGGNGGNGGNGAYGNDGETGGGKDNGVSGGDGGKGGDGGAGGNGAEPIKYDSFNNYLLNLNLHGGRGGKAGDGGNGGNGGHGGKGANNPGFLFFTSNFAGRGGNGGNGGAGGSKGMNGTDAENCIEFESSEVEPTDGMMGFLGTAGNGGDGPIGGANGSDGKGRKPN